MQCPATELYGLAMKGEHRKQESGDPSTWLALPLATYNRLALTYQQGWSTSPSFTFWQLHLPDLLCPMFCSLQPCLQNHFAPCWLLCCLTYDNKVGACTHAFCVELQPLLTLVGQRTHNDESTTSNRVTDSVHPRSELPLASTAPSTKHSIHV